MKHESMISQLPAKLRLSVVASMLLVLSACGGGAPTTQNQQTSPGSASANDYKGPTAANGDVSAFQINVWNNLRDDSRCGTCHNATQSPRFVRSDDINLAYQEANTVVDLTNPGLSRMVAKVAGGHHCWETSNSVCATQLTNWITAWANVTAGGGGKTIQLVAPTLKDPGASKAFPLDPSLFATTVYPVLVDADKGNCGRCHSADSTTKQQPYFATKPATNSPADVAAALATSYAQVQPKINLDAPASSRLVVRLRDESHNCWRVNGATVVSCVDSSKMMEDAIVAFANGITVTPIPAQWKVSKSLTMYDGTVASGGTRYDNNVIAMYQFKEGNDPDPNARLMAHDTSGIDPAVHLTLSGGYQWVGGWGIQFTGGKAQGSTTASKKIRDMIVSTGEFSIEAWAAPANVTQEESRIVTYSGGLTTRNFMLGQSLYNYDFFTRSSVDASGMRQLSTPDAQRALQATLQHVVVTYSPGTGRRIYVNGAYTNTMDQSVGNLANWDDALVLILGNEAGNNRPWYGTLKMVAIHNRALTAAQIKQNFDAGVGEKYFVLFSVSHLVNVPQAYVMFEVSQYDSYAYLFKDPKFISLDPTALPGTIPIKGMRIGVNGAEPAVGQAYKTLNTTVTDSIYSSVGGASLSSVGTIIGLERGPAADEFFLTFEQIGTNVDARTEPAPLTPAVPSNSPRPSDIGVRTFDGINDTLSQVTGISKNASGPKATFDNLRRGLPATADFGSFLYSHQMGVSQLAITYCNALVDDTTGIRTAFFGAGINAALASNLTLQADIDAVINPIVDKVAGIGVSNQPSVALRAELQGLIANTSTTGSAGRSLGLCAGTNSCGGTRTATAIKAACAVGLGSAVMLVN